MGKQLMEEKMRTFEKSAGLALDRLGIHPTPSQQAFMEGWEEEAYDAGQYAATQNIRALVEATDQLIAETDVECDCVEAWTSIVEPRSCAKHAAIEALKPFQKEKK